METAGCEIICAHCPSSESRDRYNGLTENEKKSENYSGADQCGSVEVI